MNFFLIILFEVIKSKIVLRQFVEKHIKLFLFL